jgi:hypothetical protein
MSEPESYSSNDCSGASSHCIPWSCHCPAQPVFVMECEENGARLRANKYEDYKTVYSHLKLPSS